MSASQPCIDPKAGSPISDWLSDGVETAIGRMRAAGLNKIESIKILRDHAGISLGDAKDRVHLSPAWNDRFETDERLHDELERVAMRLTLPARH